MNAVWQRLPLFLAALWWGSLTAVGAWVVPTLFAQLPTPALAGNTAARLFSAQTWVALACGFGLLLLTRRPDAPKASYRGLATAGVWLALVVEFVVSPHIVARDDLRLWHSLGSLGFALQWLCAAGVLWRLAPAAMAAPDAQP